MRLVSILVLCGVFSSCGNQGPAGGSFVAKPEAPVTVKPDSGDKPAPVMSALPPLKDDLIKALEGAGLSAATGRYDMADLRLTGPGKREFSLSAQKGKVVMLNLWATWCPPCRNEMPTMDALYRKMQGKPFVMAAVSIGEEPGTVVEFLSTTPFNFPIYWDPDNSVTGPLSTGSIPTTYLIGKDGRMVGRMVGAMDWNAPKLDKLWDILLNE